MKSTLFFVAALAAATATGQVAGPQQQPLLSDVYSWKNLQAEKQPTSEKRLIAEGSGAVLSHLTIYAITLKPGAIPRETHIYNEEVLIIVKEGRLRVTIQDHARVLGPGSIAVVMPGDQYSVENAGHTKATCYILAYTSKTSPDSKRAASAGGSFMMNWNDIAFTPHDKGGIRRYFERPTAMINRFEMHVTTLNKGLKSHEPHTHRAEEIVLMIEGNAEMQIGDTIKKAAPGDLIYLGSNVSHAIRNDDTRPCMYFAFQWE